MTVMLAESGMKVWANQVYVIRLMPISRLSHFEWLSRGSEELSGLFYLRRHRGARESALFFRAITVTVRKAAGESKATEASPWDSSAEVSGMPLSAQATVC
jgi:hypothetical protein